MWKNIFPNSDIMESVGIYEYRSKDLIGHGAFAVVYRGRIKMVRIIIYITKLYIIGP